MTQTSSAWQSWRARVDLEEYDAKWQQMEAAGENPHGEVDFVCRFMPQLVLDAGCGTGRVTIELNRRGVICHGVDLDGDLLAVAHRKAPELTWTLCDLADLPAALPEAAFDVVVAAGNVFRFVEVSRQAQAVAGCAAQLAPGGRLIAGFQLGQPSPTLLDYDNWAAAAGLELEARFAGWSCEEFPRGAEYSAASYAVSVHRRT